MRKEGVQSLNKEEPSNYKLQFMSSHDGKIKEFGGKVKRNEDGDGKGLREV